MASLAVKAAYLELLPRFEGAGGGKVETGWVGMADIRKRMSAGESVDLVIGSAALVDELTGAGHLARGSRVDIAKSGAGVAVRAGAPKPDIHSVEALKRAMRTAKSIVYSSGPSGVYLAALFQRWGIAEELRGKMTQTPPGVLVGELVARGEKELAFQQIPELLQVKGIDYVGPLPPEIQIVTVFAGAIHARAADAQGARAWMEFLASPAAAETMRKKGFER